MGPGRCGRRRLCCMEVEVERQQEQTNVHTGWLFVPPTINAHDLINASEPARTPTGHFNSDPPADIFNRRRDRLPSDAISTGPARASCPFYLPCSCSGVVAGGSH